MPTFSCGFLCSGFRAGALALILAFSGSVGLAQTADSRSACEKAETMWNSNILPSRYATLPPLVSVGLRDVIRMGDSDFSIRVLTNESDELDAGRRKLVHAFGAEARLRLEINSGAGNRYTGIFRSGAQCAIGRFSMANKPTEEGAVPALALKIFIDGQRPSVNLHLMNSADGQQGHNFFALPFSNILPPAQSYSTALLDRLFGEAAVKYGAKDPNPGRLTLDHLAGVALDGTPVAAPVMPYQLVFRPSEAAQASMRGARAEDDFRLLLAELPPGLVLYEIFAVDEGESLEEARLLGRLILSSPIIASAYGDEKLHFQHHMARRNEP